jgi:uncharacterized protein
MKLQIKVIPSSSRDSFAGWLDDTLKIKVKAPPENGRANKAVIRFLEKALSLAKGSASITAGHTSARKTVIINDENEAGIRQKIADIVDR